MLYIAGDVHLDGRNGGERFFCLFLDLLLARPPAHLVLLGDLFDYWVESVAMEQLHAGVLSRLRRLAAAGWRLDMVQGNRELDAGRRLEAASRCRMHWPAIDLRVGARVVRVVHGDRLCHDPGYHFYAAWLRSFWWRAFSACFPPAMHDAVARWLRVNSKKRRVTRTARSIFLDPRRVRAGGRGADTLVAGHIHESWRRTVGGVDLILVGDWPAHRGHWIEGFADGQLARVRHDF